MPGSPASGPLPRLAVAAALAALAGLASAEEEDARAPEGEEQAPADVATEPASPPRPGTPVDAGHAALERLLWKALAFDRFFGNDGDLDPHRRRSWVAFRNDLRLTDAHGSEYSASLRADLRLPGLERVFRDRLRMVVEGVSADADALLPDGEPLPEGGPRLGRDAAASLRYAFVDRLGFDVSASAGALLRLPPEAVVRLRTRYALPAGDLFLVRLALVPFWRTDLGLGATASADLQRELGGFALARLGGTATANEEEWPRGLQWSSEVAVLRSFGPRAAASLAYGVRGFTRPVARVESHRVYLRGRTAFLRPWLFVELEPEALWPMTDPSIRGPVLGAILRLELQIRERGDEPPTETGSPPHPDPLPRPAGGME